MSYDWTPPPPPQFPPPVPPRRRRGALVGVGLVGAGVAAGVIVGAATLSNAATTTTTPSAAATTSSSTAAGTPTDNDRANGAVNDHGSDPVRSDEKALSASLTAKLKAAALKAVPGGTVYRIESDSGDGVYEAHMTKANGDEVTVKFDKSGKVTAVESGMGKGGPGDHRH